MSALEEGPVADDQVVERKLAVIFAADVAEYSRLMGLDEVGTLRTLQAYRAILDRMIATHHGRIFNTAGDSVMADFASPVDAVECAVAVQEAIDKDVPTPIITLSLLTRFRSRQDESYGAKVLAALRNEFGGHAVKTE